MAARPGKHASTDYLKHYCADEAWRLLQLHFKTAASGSATSVFGKIASFLYEGVTGEYGVDVERQCKAALRRAQEGTLAVDGQRTGRFFKLPRTQND